eukprot:2371119-Prymnesium_polylepis.1
MAGARLKKSTCLCTHGAGSFGMADANDQVSGGFTPGFGAVLAAVSPLTEYTYSYTAQRFRQFRVPRTPRTSTARPHVATVVSQFGTRRGRLDADFAHAH